MVISWYGEGCFKIQSGERVVLTDPPEPVSGIGAPRLKADVLIKTICPWPSPKSIGENADFIVLGAGEYDVGGVKIRGFSLNSESSDKFFKTVFVIRWDQITIGLLGHLSSQPPPEIMENFEEVDILIAPAGGTPFLSQELVGKLVKQLNPKIFLPSFYKVAGLKRKAQGVEEIFSRFNGEAERGLERFVFKKKDLEALKKTKIVTLKI
ncbi:MAG: Zn-dependent hydrolase of the beta-lactamase fold-like protein [Candidatus Wolfebacteria bacterium GW2011_GWC1_43_10]|uniref:Zn-dependent hydrolase of the beta-lactamase fold-like protein n=1 Tax=Candidatus Wolfebacteria bacterium GW2011_GWC1_43_10 TaxID=1619011 RepID=A0A0G1F6M5_9BACT|nr:MAG: Zn-dependent hydrolase of the beta-lactamase fold-like protein [Candidatus Wolfebacteria bacterium GW2011_GWC1_43_10]KKT23118.1 MAG: Zn-dependent hydrolase of the beta-lactamase fold-like protein [Parcubacteria group bacterium GW2011_GWB1_43_8b]KKT85605.1 MAG: Zn-dependent hydrolase of the beta-lactamase fold-like protein [Parcubacteria group bacterium GW2011_GWA1_Parcubacteria_45_10]